MKIHEYQAKEIFKLYNIPIQKGSVAATPEEAEIIAQKLNCPVVIKAQVHAGGRGHAGGIKMADTPSETKKITAQILGMKIKNLIVEKVLLTERKEITKEYYVGITIDRENKKLALIGSRKGGVDIEEVAASSPEEILKVLFDPVSGLFDFQIRTVIYKMGIPSNFINSTVKIIKNMSKLFSENDCTLVEINPLCVTSDDEIIALDAKINFDDNALFRHESISRMEKESPEDVSELEAKEKGLSYVKLDGDVGCIVNGAGLAMATMDMIKYYGSSPANFLDIGGSSNPEKVLKAMKLILRDKSVKAILFNIFGGITRCDDVANGIIDSLKSMNVPVPIVIRLTGTNEDIARKILENAKIASTTSMDEAIKKVIEITR